MSKAAATPEADSLPPAQRQRRRSRRRLVLAASLLVVLPLILVAYLLISARLLIGDGMKQINLARAEVNTTTSASADRALGRATRSIHHAYSDFSAANDRLEPLRPLLARLTWVPYVGDQLGAAAPATRLAATTSEGLLALLNGVRPALADAEHEKRGHRLATLLTGIAGHRTSFQRAYTLFSSAMRLRAELPAHPSAQLASALGSVDRTLPPLRAAALGLERAPLLLGTPTPMTYFVAYQDPLELRPTGGFIGSFGLIAVNHGALKQQFEGSEIGKREKLLVPAPEPIRYYNEIWWLLRDSNWSPNFPTTAALERYFVRMDLGVDPTGVINVTPQAAAAALAATGPIYIPEYHRWVNAGNLAQLTDYYSHWAPHPSKQFIGIVGTRLISRIQSLDFHGWLQLASSLQNAVARGDLLMDFPDAQDERLVRLLGAGGAINGTTGDYLYVVDANLSYNKINRWVHDTIRYDVTIRPDRWLDARLTIRMWNQPEPPSRMSQGKGPAWGLMGGPDDYASYLRMLVPAGGQLVDQSGWRDPWTPGPAYGKMEFPGYVIVRRGRTAVIRLHYVVPPNVFSWSKGRRYRLTIQHQPGSHPDAIYVTVHDALGTTRAWHLAHPLRTWSVTVPIVPRAVRPIPLPRQQPPVVAPGHWIEPHLFLQGPHV